MLSKWQIWDFFQSVEAGDYKKHTGKVALIAFDSFSLRMVKDHLLQGIDKNQRPKQLVGMDMSLPWMEEEFLSLSLFAEQESYMINEADGMNAPCKEFCLKGEWEIDPRSLWLCFDHDSAWAKKIAQNKNYSVIHIEAPRFWEMNKLIGFFCTFYRLPLNFESKTYIQEAIEQDFSAYYQCFEILKLNLADEKDINLEKIKLFVVKSRLDQFQLATLFSQKKFEQFFDLLLESEIDYDRYRQIFSFLQSHLIKLADPSYLQSKTRLTNYDKEIQSLSKMWTMDKIVKSTRQLHDWEMACKRKDPNLAVELKKTAINIQGQREGI